MLFNGAKVLAELVRPWLEAGAAMAIVLLLCLLAGVDTTSGPEYQDRMLAAAQKGKTQHIDEAMRAGTSLEIRDENGLTPLMIAARAGQDEVVKYLLGHGANVNAVSGRFGTALMLACRNEKVRTVRILLGADADIKLTDDAGNNAETWAKESGNKAIVELVIAASGTFSPSATGATSPVAK